jgi:8-oxo-dGTP pyrophosphatase MutT (NUDIX family)
VPVVQPDRPPVLLAAGDARLVPSGSLSDVTALLAGLRLDGGQSEVRRRMLAFASDHDDALTRASVTGHFTGSALVVEEGTSRTLLLFHRKLQRWLQPGGHADGDATLAAVALREATEETGIVGLRVDPVPIDLDIHEVSSANEASHLHLDVRFLVSSPAGARVAGNHESEALRWVEPLADDLGELALDVGTHRLITAGLARRGDHI